MFAHGHEEIAGRVHVESIPPAPSRSSRSLPRGNDRWTGSFIPDRARDVALHGWRAGPTGTPRGVRVRAPVAPPASPPRSTGEDGAVLVDAAAARAAGRRRQERSPAAAREPAARRSRPGRGIAEIGELVARHPDRTDAGAPFPSVRARRRPPPGELLRVVRAVPALDRSRPGPSGHAAGLHRPTRPTWPSSGSTCSTCRRSTRSASPTARDADNAAAPRAPTIRAARGPSATPTAATPRSTPGSGPSTTSPALVAEAAAHGIEVALDLAFQCSPDHPWVAEHPEWFAHRSDGSIQYAENPPKRYEDVLPLDFAGPGWPLAVGGVPRGDAELDRNAACASSASTTRTRSRSPSGRGCSARCGAPTPTCCSSRRRSPDRR